MRSHRVEKKTYSTILIIDQIIDLHVANHNALISKSSAEFMLPHMLNTLKETTLIHVHRRIYCLYYFCRRLKHIHESGSLQHNTQTYYLTYAYHPDL